MMVMKDCKKRGKIGEKKGKWIWFDGDDDDDIYISEMLRNAGDFEGENNENEENKEFCVVK